MSAGVLAKILAAKRAEVAAHPELVGSDAGRTPSGDVLSRLRRGPGEPLRLIAEIKRRSPSAGELSRILAPAARALAYAEAGATMISVLTDSAFFDGSFVDLAGCRDALEAALGPKRPLLLCKEFVIDASQLDRARDAGADAVLLIARIIPESELARLADAARERGLEPLVEVATMPELAAAAAARAALIGVNARDLDTLAMDPARAASVLASIDAATVKVHLSGLGSPADVASVAEGPADAALIGEALMRKDDPRELLGAMVGAANARA